MPAPATTDEAAAGAGSNTPHANTGAGCLLGCNLVVRARIFLLSSVTHMR
jgi:hypothetical protein